MSDLSHRLSQELEKLKQHRDELRVQLDLGKKEVEDALAEVDAKWTELEGKVLAMKRESQETMEDIGEAAEKLVEEVKAGFKRLTGML